MGVVMPSVAAVVMPSVAVSGVVIMVMVVVSSVLGVVVMGVMIVTRVVVVPFVVVVSTMPVLGLVVMGVMIVTGVVVVIMLRDGRRPSCPCVGMAFVTRFAMSVTGMVVSGTCSWPGPLLVRLSAVVLGHMPTPFGSAKYNTLNSASPCKHIPLTFFHPAELS